MSGPTQRPPKSEAHLALGEELRRIRREASKTMRDLEQFSVSSGYISEIENGHKTPSNRVIQIYVDLGGDHARLRILLTNARTADDSEDSTESTDDALEEKLTDPETDPNELRRGYRVEWIDEYYKVGPDRVLREVISSQRVYPLFPSTRFVVGRCGYQGEPRRGVVRVEEVRGGRVARLSESENGIVDTATELFRSGTPEELAPCEVSIRYSVHSTMPVTSPIAMGTRTLVPRMISRIEFHPVATPRQIWWLRQHDVPLISKPNPARTFPPSPHHYYAREFADVRGEFIGLAWEWDDFGH